MKTAIEREAAEKELENILDFFEVDPDGADWKESKKALKLISEEYEPIPTDWKIRYQMNLDLIKSGSIMDIALVVRTLFHRSQIKELPILERKLFDNALRLFVDELSISLNKSKEDIETLIFGKMEAGNK